MAQFHDYFRLGASQNVAYAAAGGSSTASTAFGSQTRWIKVCAVGPVGASNDGVRINIGDGTPVASSTSSLLELNMSQIFQVTPGQKLAALSNNTTTGTVNVTELSN